MRTKTLMALLAAGIVVAALSASNPASANERNRTKKLNGAARHELGRDMAELQRDRADLRNLYRSGASRGDIYRKRAEIRDDLREIAQDRQQLYGRYDDYRYDHYRYGSNDRWRRNDNSWWNWGNYWGGRDRWDYHR